MQNKLDEAIYHYSETVRIAPRYVRALNGLGIAFCKSGRIDEGIYYYKRALEINPRLTEVHLNLASALIVKGARAEAAEHFEEALRLEPDWVEPMNGLAWFLATSGKTITHNLDKAVRLAQRACELTNYRKPELLDTLAAAYAATGDFGKAIETAEKALELCQSSEQESLKEEIKNRLVLFEAGKPYIKTQ